MLKEGVNGAIEVKVLVNQSVVGDGSSACIFNC